MTFNIFLILDGIWTHSFDAHSLKMPKFIINLLNFDTLLTTRLIVSSPAFALLLFWFRKYYLIKVQIDYRLFYVLCNKFKIDNGYIS